MLAKPKLEEIQEQELDDEIKKLNGKSARELRKCIEELEEAIEDASEKK